MSSACYHVTQHYNDLDAENDLNAESQRFWVENQVDDDHSLITSYYSINILKIFGCIEIT